MTPCCVRAVSTVTSPLTCRIRAGAARRSSRSTWPTFWPKASSRWAKDVTLPVLAHRTYSYSGAEIKGVCNRAKILAAERYAPAIEKLKKQGKTVAEIKKILGMEILLREFDEAVDFVRYGNEAASKQKEMAEKDKHNTAVHRRPVTLLPPQPFRTAIRW